MSHLNIGNISELTDAGEHFSVSTVDEVTVINGETLHLLFSFIHWEFRSGSGHRHQVGSC